MLKEDFDFRKWNSYTGQIIDQLECPTFWDVLCDAIQYLVQIDIPFVTIEKKNLAPTMIFERGILPQNRTNHIGSYLTKGYILDPLYQAIFKGYTPGFYHLKELAPDNFYQSEYYKVFYKQTGLLEDVYYIAHLKGNSMLSMSLSRNRNKLPFNDRELHLLKAIEPVVLSFLTRHFEFIGLQHDVLNTSQAGLDDQLKIASMNFGRSILTQRESEIVQLMLRGHSVKSTANDLNISIDTVKSHRKNLYEKLEISSQSELFLLFFDSLAFAKHSKDYDPLAGYRKSL
jgi:DNA-binding CsgD family transcriptional regulator